MPPTTETAVAPPPKTSPETIPFSTISCVLETVQEVNAAADLDAALERVAARLARDVPHDTFAVLLLDDAGALLSVRFARGLPPEIVDAWRFGLGQGLVGVAARDRTTCSAGDGATGPGAATLLPDLRSEVDFPLVAKDRTVGVLHLGARRADAFDDPCRELLELVAGHLASAIDNGRLYANLRKQAQTLSVLHQASRELAAAVLDHDALLRRIADLVRGLIDYTYFNVLILGDAGDDAARELKSVFTMRGGVEIEDDLVLRLGEGIVGTAAALRRAVRVPNVDVDPRYRGCSGIKARSELAVPLLFEDRLIGVLNLESARYDAFSEDDEQLLSTLAAHVAVAMENARLVHRLRADERRLAEDLDTARRIQRFLLPRETPWVPGLQIAVAYHPARHLGGDLYDVLAFAGDRTVVALGDVAGKGTGAALYGTLALGMLRGFAGDNPCNPACLFHYLDGELRALRPGRRFLALAAVLYDRRQGVFTLGNAGLPHPWKVGPGAAVELAAEGIPIGAMSGAEWREERLRLAPGESLVLVSDGVEDCLDARDRPFGPERLRETLLALADRPADAIAEGLVAATDRHRGPRHPSDDRTVVVLKATADVAPAG